MSYRPRNLLEAVSPRHYMIGATARSLSRHVGCAAPAKPMSDWQIAAIVAFFPAVIVAGIVGLALDAVLALNGIALGDWSILAVIALNLVAWLLATVAACAWWRHGA